MKLPAKALPPLLLLACVLNSPLSAAQATPRTPQNADVRSAAWQTLFDGQTLQGWRPYGKPGAGSADIPAGWRVESGLLHKLPGVKGGDIITERTFLDFELEWEWKLAPGANNGVKYMVTEKRPGAPGLEYQMIDDSAPKWIKLEAKSKTASLYEVLAPSANKNLKPAGEWNASRIVVRGSKIEHHLNGRLVLACELGSQAVKDGIAGSKFKKYPDFGDKISGHIMLTDHQDETWFRSIRIRELSNN